MVICLERDADLHVAQLMPLPLTVSCFSKIQIGFTFLVPAHPGSPEKRTIKWVLIDQLFLSSCVYVAYTATHPVQAAGCNARLIQFWILALFILFVCLYCVLPHLFHFLHFFLISSIYLFL